MCKSVYVPVLIGESKFYHCGGPVKLVQSCLCAGNTLQHHFNRGEGVMRHVKVCLCASTDRESSFHHSGGPVKLVQAFLCVENTLQRRFNGRGGAGKHVQTC